MTVFYPLRSSAHVQSFAAVDMMYISSTIYSTLLLLLLILFHSAAKDVGPCQAKSAVGSHCFSPDAQWQFDGTCAQLKDKHRCHVPDTRDFKFELRISIQKLMSSSTSGSRPLEKLWIRGNGLGLSWDTPVKLQKSAKGLGLWVIEVGYTYDSKSTLCLKPAHCLFNQRALEFRVYQDKEGKHDMIGPNLLVNLPVQDSMFSKNFILPTVDVYPWFEGAAITIENVTLTDLPAPFEKLTASLLFPPSFDYNVRRKYPVVILFGSGEGIRVSPLLETMYSHEASIVETFVINIHYFDSAPFCAFNPYSKANSGTVNSIWRCKDDHQCKMFKFCWFSECDDELFEEGTRTYLHAVSCSGSGEIMLDIIEERLIPTAKTKASGRLLLNFPKNRLTVIGYDGAGLLACHAAVSRPHIYGNAACLSAPFHWPLNVRPGGDSPPADATGISKALSNASEEFLFYPEKRAFYMSQKYYIDYGEKDNDFFPLIKARQYIQWVIDKLKIEFGVLPENILYFKRVLRSCNNYFTHADGGTEVLNRIRMPLLFFFGAEGGPNVAFPSLILPIQGMDPDEEVEEEEDESVIPEECLLQFQIFQRKNEKTNSVPLAILLIYVGEYLDSYTCKGVCHCLHGPVQGGQCNSRL